ncbi:hypothetical protein T459_15334 [Capsicum annuum]|uniref:Rx N-terminal domain-containing protein n=1 Tax=Capsicum annuum TaxID=4072 RepID=A0A2G2ZK08_CAPAN|nr:hypothetical protein FXO37_23362 [Capsicum annuum]PHT82319.1 hypothetical protein T459_15334 [Capsicum annuum]
MSDGLLFMTLLLRNLNYLLNSNAYSVVLIKEEIGRVKEHLEHIRSFFGNVEQELYRDLWIGVLDVAYEAKHAIKSILARDHGLLQLIFLLPDAVEKIKLVKKEVQEKISQKTSITFTNSPNKPVESKSSTAGKIFVSFEEETQWIIRKLTSGPTEIDIISIVGREEGVNDDGQFPMRLRDGGMLRSGPNSHLSIFSEPPRLWHVTVAHEIGIPVIF